jgi:two-component system LytT family response regulator
VIKAIVVDDEPPARREMRRLLGAFDDIKIVGEAGDIEVAAGLLQRTRPDAVFLDIKLGRRSGFELLDSIDNETAVVFVTAYDEFAVRAFEASALDYLVKPVDKNRLSATVERLEKHSADRHATTSHGIAPFSSARWVFIESSRGSEFVEVAKIACIEADVGGSRVHTNDGRVRESSRALVSWEDRLANGDFVRVHRNAIVNLRFVERVDEWSHYSYRLKLTGVKEPVIMSRRHAARLRDAMK